MRFTLSFTLPSPEASPSKKDLKGEGIKSESALRQAQCERNIVHFHSNDRQSPHWSFDLRCWLDYHRQLVMP